MPPLRIVALLGRGARNSGLPARQRSSMGVPVPPAPESDVPEAQRPKVFVSYSRRDGAFAAILVTHLEARAFQPFLDRTDIAPGEPWQDRLAGLIRVADTMVFLVGPDSSHSAICEWEVTEAARLGKRIIPLVCRPTDDAAIPAALARLNFIFATEPEDMANAMARLDHGLRQDIGWVREHTRLTEIAVRWDDGGRKRSQALRGSDLEAAERWLSHPPGQSGHPTVLHRDLVRFSRRAQRLRQRAWVVGSGLVAVVALGLAGLAEISRRRADDALQAARATANTLVSDLATGLRDKVGMPVTLVRSILEPALALQDRLISSGGVSPALRADQSHALALMTVTLLRVGDTQGALKTATRSRDIAAALQRAAPNSPPLRSQLSESLRAVALAEEKSGDLSAARAAVVQRVTVARQNIGSPPQAQASHELLDALIMLGQAESATDDVGGAAKALEEALQLSRTASDGAATPQHERDLMEILVQLSVLKLRAGDSNAASQALREAYGLATRAALDETDAAARRDLAQTLMTMAVSFFRLNDPASEFSSLTQSLDIRRQLAADKTNYEAQLALAGALFAAGGLRSINGLNDAGIRDLSESISIYRALARDGSHPAVRIALANTLTLVAQARVMARAPPGEAVAELLEAIALYRTDGRDLDKQSQAFFKQAEALLAKLQHIDTG